MEMKTPPKLIIKKFIFIFSIALIGCNKHHSFVSGGMFYNVPYNTFTIKEHQPINPVMIESIYVGNSGYWTCRVVDSVGHEWEILQTVFENESPVVKLKL